MRRSVLPSLLICLAFACIALGADTGQEGAAGHETKSEARESGIEGIFWRELDPEAGPGPLWTEGDVLVYGSSAFDVTPSLAGAGNGRLFCALEKKGTPISSIHVSYSDDGGRTWKQWTEIWSGGGYDLKSPSVAVGESGGEDYMLFAFVDEVGKVVVFRSPIDSLDLSGAIVETNPLGVSNPEITTDATEYSPWFGYLVYNTKDSLADRWVLQFSRSLDFGETWSAPAPLFAYDSTYNGYDAYPDIEFGSTVLYVAFDDYRWGALDRNIYVTRSTDFGTSWLAWGEVAGSALDEFAPRLGAIKGFPAGNRAIVAYTADLGGGNCDIRYTYTLTGGADWSPYWEIAADPARYEAYCDVATSNIGGRFHVAYYDEGTIRYEYSDWDDFTNWSAPQDASDEGVATPTWPRPAIGIIPSMPLDEEAGVAWTDYRVLNREIYYDSPYIPDAGVADDDLHRRDPASVSCHPNPCTASTLISFDLRGHTEVGADIYDTSGRRVRSLLDAARLEPGRHDIQWDGRDDSGRAVGPGIYLLRVSTPGLTRQNKIVVLR